MIRVGILVLALAAMAACQAETTAPAAQVEAAPAVTPQQAGAVASYGHPVTREELIGRWTERRDCANQFIEFRENGTFLSNTGGEGRWSLSESAVTISGSGGSFMLLLRGLADGTMEATDANGAVFLETRCP